MDLYIAFERETKTEFILYNKMHISDDNESVYSLPFATDMIAPIGTFLTFFLNTDFENISECRKFILLYCFENYYYKYHPKSEISYSFIDLKLNWIDYYNEVKYIAEKEQDSFLYTKNLFLKNLGLPYNESILELSPEEDDDTNLSEETIKLANDFANHIIDMEKKKIRELFKEKYPEEYKKAKENYYSRIEKYKDIHESEISSLIITLKVDYNPIVYNFSGIPIDAHNVPYAFHSDDIIEILAIEFKEFISDKHNTVRKCQNCGQYFIPKDLRATKYCDFEMRMAKLVEKLEKKKHIRKR